jgi:hypothetical protein
MNDALLRRGNLDMDMHRGITMYRLPLPSEKSLWLSHLVYITFVWLL